MSSTDTPAVPAQYGKYELLERIGEGGMAEVFRARLPGAAGFEKILVLKRILPHLAKKPDFVRMFVDEAKLAAKVQHQNVVQVFELGEADGGELYMAMEYIAGVDLRRLLVNARERRLRIPIWFVLHTLSEVLNGLTYAHELCDADGKPLCIVHRDVTPGNIFVSYQGEVKLADFGIAKAVGRVSETEAGQVKGNAPFMAPEAIYGRTLDARADVFSAGVVLWASLALRLPFEGASNYETAKQVCEAKREPPSKFNPLVTPELDAVALQALEIERSRRVPSAREFQARLLEILSRLRPKLLPSDVRHVVDVLTGRKAPDAQFGDQRPASVTLRATGASVEEVLDVRMDTPIWDQNDPAGVVTQPMPKVVEPAPVMTPVVRDLAADLDLLPPRRPNATVPPAAAPVIQPAAISPAAPGPATWPPVGLAAPNVPPAHVATASQPQPQPSKPTQAPPPKSSQSGTYPPVLPMTSAPYASAPRATPPPQQPLPDLGEELWGNEPSPFDDSHAEMFGHLPDEPLDIQQTQLLLQQPQAYARVSTDNARPIHPAAVAEYVAQPPMVQAHPIVPHAAPIGQVLGQPMQMPMTHVGQIAPMGMTVPHMTQMAQMQHMAQMAQMQQAPQQARADNPFLQDVPLASLLDFMSEPAGPIVELQRDVEKYYNDSNKFLIRFTDGSVLTANGFDECLSFCDPWGRRAAALSIDNIAWMEISTFARLCGLDYLAPDSTPLKNVTMVGLIEERSLTSVFVQLAKQRATGKLVIMDKGVHRVARREIDVINGAPVYVYADHVSLQYPHLFVTHHLIKKELVPELVIQVLKQRQTIEEVARRTAFVDLNPYRPVFMRDRLAEIFSWRYGRFAFDAGREIRNTPPFAPSLVRVLPDAVQRGYAAEELRRDLEPFFPIKLRRADNFDAIVNELALKDKLGSAARKLGKNATLAKTVEKHPTETHAILTMARILLELEVLLPL